MCTMSMVYDHFQKTWPQPEGWTPQILPYVKPAVDNLRPLLDKLEEIDRKLGQPDCEREPKNKFLARLEKRVKELEAEVAAMKGST